jgi:hypothetical protein
MLGVYRETGRRKSGVLPLGSVAFLQTKYYEKEKLRGKGNRRGKSKCSAASSVGVKKDICSS